MPTADSPALLVARFLRSNGYERTLAVFLEETNLDVGAVDAHPATALTIEKVLDEKKLFDLSLQLESVEIEAGEDEFTLPYPSSAQSFAPPDAPPSNVLFVTIAPFTTPFSAPLLIATTADRALRLYSLSGALLRTHTHLHTSAILAVAVLREEWLITTSMSGHITLSHADTGEILSTLAAHEKYTTRAILHGDEYLATSSYDKSISVFTLPRASPPTIGPLLGRITLPTPPEALCFLTLPSGDAALAYSRRDSPLITIHLLRPQLPLHATHNLTPHSTSTWSSSHPMSIAPSPRDPGLLAVATSSTPVMKLLLLRADTGRVRMQAWAAAPQSVYSTAAVAWRPDGSGLWVNGDDGVVRGVEGRTGKVVVELVVCKGGEKVRGLWAGEVDGREVLVTGGFDKGLKVWWVQGEEGGWVNDR